MQHYLNGCASFLLSLLAEKEKGKLKDYTSIAALSYENDLPYAFISRIAAELKAAKILTSREGAGGGYKLAGDPSKISVGKVIEILDGPFSPTKCTNEEEKCKYEKKCLICNFWQDSLKKQIAKILNDHTLEDLMGKKKF